MSTTEKKNDFIFVSFLENEKGAKIFTRKVSNKCTGLNINYESDGVLYNASFLLPSCFIKTSMTDKNKGRQFISIPSDMNVEVSFWNYNTKVSTTEKYTAKTLKNVIKKIFDLTSIKTKKSSKINEDELPF